MAGGVAGQPTEVMQGSLIFDQMEETVNQAVVNGNFSNGAVPDQNLRFAFGDSIDELGTGEKGTTQYGSKNAMFRNVQDGWAAGILVDTGIDGDGMVTGVYTNGQNRVLGQLAIARFEATERLNKVGENQFRESAESGIPVIGKANTNGRGVVMTRVLSNPTWIWLTNSST